VNLWLARITLDTRHRAVRHDLRDTVAMHRRLMSLFHDDLGEQPRAQAAALYRLEDTPTGPAVLVQSTRRPAPDKLPTGYGHFDLRELTPLLDALKPGTLVHYRIAANPTKRAWKGDRAGKIVALAGADADAWWNRQAPQHGLDLLSLVSSPQPTAHGERNGERSNAKVTHVVTRFDGRAVVSDVDQVRAAVTAGIGRGKSFGCGLLSLALVANRA
jgi:CRISPR system Cascade subunit CasE